MKFQPPVFLDRQSIRAAYRQGRIILNGWCAIPDTLSAEIMALQDWDTLTVDLQHGIVDYQVAVEMLRVIQGKGVTALSRIPWLDPIAAMKMLDAGAAGLICPMVTTAEQAAEFVSYCRYPPQGIRSYGPTRAGLLDADYAAQANERIICAVQIEEIAAVEALERIAAAPGLDMLYIGPADLAMSMGLPPVLDADAPELLAIYERVVAACRKHDLVPAIHCLTPAYAARMHRMGFGLATISSDLRLLARAAKETVDNARGADNSRTGA